MDAYTTKETEILNKINLLMTKLDQTLAKIGDTDDRVKEYAEQEKALNEVKTILHNESGLNKLHDKEHTESPKKAQDWADDQVSIMDDINDQLDKLDETLKKLKETDSKLMGYIEQKKAIHHIKSIVRKGEKLEA